jgi:hypothetical protein
MKKGLTAFAFFGGLWRLLVIALVAGLIYRNEKAIDAALPRVNEKPGALREALGFPWKGFPEISDAERKELDNLIPLDPAIRFSDIRPWTTWPSDPILGGFAASRNTALRDAFVVIDGIQAYRRDRSDPSFNEAEKIAEAKNLLASAQETATPPMVWLIHYNRGVVYAWEGNRQRAASEFARAVGKLTPVLRSGPVSDEVRSAAIHAYYGWGDALFDSAASAAESQKAIVALRLAVVEATNRFKVKNRGGGVAYGAAEFHELEPTGLSTRVLRNDLLAGYLGAPQYSYCGKQPMAADVCETQQFAGPCKYRDERFCKTKGRNPLQGVFEAQVKEFAAGRSNEAIVWALQNAVEIDAENPLHQEPVVAYNIAKLLHDLKRPDLAYRFINPITTGDRRDDVTKAMVRLGWVSSILANEKEGAMPAPKSNAPSSGYRVAYLKLHPPDAKHQPPMFNPLQLDDAEKAKSLDAWLFIRRYRYLLSRGELETFIDEHRRLNALGDAPRDFLDAWKRDVVVDFLRRAAQVREKAQPATKATINTFLTRSDLFEDAELKKAGIGRPFAARKLRWLLYLLALPLLLWLVYGYVWRLQAYRSTFESAYQRDRRARMRA